MKRWMLYLIAAVFAAMPALALAQGAVELPQTGQKQCYDASGAVIDCLTAGQTQDAAVQAGVVWPEPRFTDNLNGTVTDNLTGLIWLKDANCFGTKTWADALSYANNLVNGACGLSDGSVAGDWSLPNIVELESLFHAGFNEEDCSGSLCGTNAAWLNTESFINVQPNAYWSGTSSAQYTDSLALAWFVHMWDGVVLGTGKSSGNYVWLVRGSLDPSVISLPRTGQRTSYASGDDGDLERGVAWPDQRFQLTYCDGSGPCGDQSSDCDADPSNDVVYDSLTDRTWARDANLPGSITNWQGALDDVDSLNGVSGLCGKADWHLPNRKELFSLVDYSQYDPALQAGYPFVNVQLDYLYWSGTSCAYAGTTHAAWDVYMWNGLVHEGYKSGWNYVWLVRAGQVGPSVNSDISVTKTDDPDPVFTGGELIYTVTITNNGPDDATGVTLTDAFPGGVMFESATSDQGSCSEAGGVVTCDIGDMISGASDIVTIIVTAPDTEGAITNTATVDSTSNDSDTSNNTATEETTVIYYSSNSNISVTKLDEPDPVATGAELTYTATIINNGPDDATGVTLTDTLPGGVMFESATSDQGSCSEAGGVVTCDIGDMENGTSDIVTIIVTAPDTAGSITNTATVDCTSNDPDMSDNTHIEDTIVQSSEPSIEEIIDFFEQGVDDDTLEGSSWIWWGWWGQTQLNIMRRYLTTASYYIERGWIGAACFQLRRAYLGCDGVGYDWVVGEDAEELAQMIYDLAVSLDCWWT